MKKEGRMSSSCQSRSLCTLGWRLVGQAVSQQPMEVNGEGNIHLQAVCGGFCAGVGGCNRSRVGPHEKHWSRLLAVPLNLWRKEFKLDQIHRRGFSRIINRLWHLCPGSVRKYFTKCDSEAENSRKLQTKMELWLFFRVQSKMEQLQPQDHMLRKTK